MTGLKQTDTVLRGAGNGRIEQVELFSMLGQYAYRELAAESALAFQAAP